MYVSAPYDLVHYGEVCTAIICLSESALVVLILRRKSTVMALQLLAFCAQGSVTFSAPLETAWSASQ
jgi:hypothetical protein